MDDWVLCRIYKKQSSAQKQAYENGITSNGEFSNNGTSSTTSSSSHFEDVLDSLHHEKIDNRNMQFSNDPNQFSSLRPDLTEQKPEFNGLLDTSSFDWSSFAGNGEHNSVGMSHVVPNLEYNCGYLKTEEEVESSLGIQRFENSGALAHNGYGVDSIGFGYSGQVDGFGFM